MTHESGSGGGQFGEGDQLDKLKKISEDAVAFERDPVGAMFSDTFSGGGWSMEYSKKMALIEMAKARVRTPVVDRNTEDRTAFIESKRFCTIRRQWVELTGMIKKIMLRDLGVRVVLQEIIDTPASESLIKDVCKKLGERNTEIGEFLRTHNELATYIQYPPVPDECITKENTPEGFKEFIAGADQIPNPFVVFGEMERIIGEDTSLKTDTEREDRVREEFSVAVEGGRFSKGISEEERAIVVRRYTMARDLKILALGAELAELDSVTTEDGEVIPIKPGMGVSVGRTLLKRLGQREGSDPSAMDRDIRLDSGIDIRVVDTGTEELQVLLNPGTWVKRAQKKDRIHFADVRFDTMLPLTEEERETAYVIKERKGFRHRDTMSNKRANTSPDEVETARELYLNGQVTDGDVAMAWERPVCSVVFPDKGDKPHEEAFQFALFERQKNLVSTNDVVSKMVDVLLSEKYMEQTKVEYDLFMAERLPDFLAEEYFKKTLDAYRNKISKRRVKKDGGIVYPISDNQEVYERDLSVDELREKITVEFYARMKATLMVFKGFQLLEESKREAGFMDADQGIDADFLVGNDPYTEGKEPFLRLFAYDTEYFEKMPWHGDGGKRPESDMVDQEQENQESLLSKQAWAFIGFDDFFRRLTKDEGRKEVDVHIARDRYLPHAFVLYCAMLYDTGMIDKDKTKTV